MNSFAIEEFQRQKVGTSGVSFFEILVKIHGIERGIGNTNVCGDLQ